jgi:hypothetical protein
VGTDVRTLRVRYTCVKGEIILKIRSWCLVGFGWHLQFIGFVLQRLSRLCVLLWLSYRCRLMACMPLGSLHSCLFYWCLSITLCMSFSDRARNGLMIGWGSSLNNMSPMDNMVPTWS